MKRKTLIAAVAICLAAILTLGTLAFFSDDDAITNKFMVTDSDQITDPDDLFSVDVTETDKDGNPTDKGLVYDDIKPGDELKKDPTITNTGKYDQWMRVKVTVSNAKNWMDACEKHNITDLTTIFGGFVAADWTRIDEPVYDAENDTLTYTFYYNAVLAPEASATLFKTVTIPSAFTVEDMVALKSFELSVLAEAIQAEHTGANAVEAFATCWGK